MRSGRKPIKYFIPGMLLLLTLSQCVREESPVPALPIWSSFEPLDIPFRQRETQFERANLVRNASFEEGRLYDLDSLSTRFNITGWKKVGDHVYWVDAMNDSLHQGEEVRTGRHAIKVHREKADETVDQGDGVISDYIRVIPGNYNLKYDIRLENVFPNRSRRGTKIFEAVDIRLIYYDKNKLLIDGTSYYPHKDIILDNTFKAFQFSNYWYINSFNWSTVNGRTCNFPYPDGDIPDEAKYVRIFLGLKGTGTMWVDNIDFRYTKNNFSPKERLMPLFDTSYSYADLVIPTPQHIEPGQPYNYYSLETDTIPLPVIYLSGNAARGTRTAAGILQAKLTAVCKELIPDSIPSDIKIINTLSNQDIESGRLIFSLGRNRQFYRNTGRIILDSIAGVEQGYIIQADSVFPNIIYLVGNDAVGDYYAAATALQLLDKQFFIYHSATVVDYPDFKDRPFLLSTWQHEHDVNFDLANLAKLSQWKLNKAYITYNLRDDKKDWYKPEPLYRSGVVDIANECRKLGTLEAVQMVNPYYHLAPGTRVDSLSDQEISAWTHSSQLSMRQLFGVMQIGGRAGVRNFVLNANDHLPVQGFCGMEFCLYSQADRKKFVNLQNAHADLINRADTWLKSNYSGTSLSFVPPWYNNEYIDESCGEGEQYLPDLMSQIPSRVRVAWAGGARDSRSVDMADIMRFNILTGRQPMYWDNSLDIRSRSFDQRVYPLYYPGKVRMHSLLEAFDVELPDSFNLYCSGDEMFVNRESSSEIARIQYATVADFLWNQSEYDPDFSLWKILVASFGKEISRHIIQFNDSYFSLESVCLRMEQQGVTNRLIRSGEDHISRMDYNIDIITEELLENQSLALELHGHKNRLINRFKKLQIRLGDEEVLLIDSVVQDEETVQQ